MSDAVELNHPRCTDCKHFYGVHNHDDWSYCRHVKAIQSISVISGNRTYQKAIYMRRSDCGTQGKLFERKKSFFTRLREFFTK